MRDKKNDKVRVLLMLESIANIDEFLKDTSSYELFAGNKVLRHAVSYNLQCIGESVYMLTREFKENHTGAKWQSIESLRHILVHDYYQVDNETLWAIIQDDLAPLKHYLQKIMVDNPDL